MRMLIGGAAAVVAVAIVVLVANLATGGVRADVDPATIDFEGLAEGAIVNSVACSSGMTCTADPGGSVGVFGLNPTFPAATNTAQIFDAECLPGGVPADCTGGDDDLFFPGQGNMLIICEEQGTSNTCKSPPDDADKVGAFFKFDFSTWGPGTVCVDSIDVGDVEGEEGGAKVELFSGGEGGTPLGTVLLPITGDNVIATDVAIGVCGVDFMRVTLNGSGAIDNIEIELEELDGEGCTPGFWKNHLDAWAATGFSPGDDFDSNFGVDLFDPDITKEDAVNARGGGVNKLARHGTAALLSAAHPDVDYPLSVAQVIAAVQAGDANTLVGFNELTAPGFCD